MSARVIVVANNKGGVGKTALVTNVGASFARRGKNTLLVDFDGQANLTDAYLDEAQVETSIAEALTERKPLPVVPIRKNLSLVPSDPTTGTLDRDVIQLFKASLQPLLPKYDIILIDTPPTIGALTIGALLSAQELIVPLCAEPSSLKGLSALHNLVAEIQEGENEGLRTLGAVLTFYDERKNLSKLVVATIEQNFEGLLCKTAIHRNIAVAEASLERTDAYSYDKRSRGAQDYEQLTKELLKRLER